MTTTLQPLEVPPVDFGQDIRYRSCRKTIRRAIAEWLRAEGLATSGQTWDRAWIGAERDIDVLAELTRADGLAPARLDGSYAPAILVPGDYLPDHGAHVLGVMRDPETGAYWVTVQTIDKRATADDYDSPAARTSVHDVEIPAGERVLVTRKPAKRR